MRTGCFTYRLSFCVLTSFYLLLLPLAPATVWEVPGDFSTIQAALDSTSVVDRDEIVVHPGTYVENVAFKGKNVVLRSTDPTSSTVVATTVIDGNDTFHVVTFAGTEYTSCVLSGFTITNGRFVSGGGIYGNNSLATIQYNVITTNTATDRGGGLIYCSGTVKDNAIVGNNADEGGGLVYCSGTVKNNTIVNNTAYKGGGLYLCLGTIRDNVISNNSATYQGGGFYGCDGTITSNTISGNYAVDNGGGFIWCDGSILNNTISGNSSGEHGGGLSFSTALIQNNTISGNYAGGLGGGIYNCSGTIRNNLITQNSCDAGGGGLDACGGNIYNNTITHNSAREGGGVCACYGTIQNNLVMGNSATMYGGGLHACHGVMVNNTVVDNSADINGGGIGFSHGFIINCIVWGNSAPSGSQFADSDAFFHCCVQGGTSGGKANISTNPQFVNPSVRNYHLQSGSPCIDSGNTYYLLGDYIADADGQCRLVGSSVDMGGYEHNGALDTDGDLLADADEVLQGTNPVNPDSDDDGLPDGVELMRGTPPGSPNTPPGISVPADYASVQQALFLAFPQEVVTVSPGTYVENLHLLGKNLTLQSTDPDNETVVNTTIIDGDALTSALFFHGSEDETCLVQGLTIRNGAGYFGGGIHGYHALTSIANNKIVQNSAAVEGGGLSRCDGSIRNNTISENSAYWAGGLSYCGSIIQDNVISNNSASGGGGLMGCNGTVQNNIVSFNTASVRGGGLFSCGGVTLRNNTITHNSAPLGGGILDCNSSTIVNCVIASNENYGFAEDDTIEDPNEIKYCDFYGNSAGDYYDFDTASAYSGTNVNNLTEVHDCISADPLLVDPGSGDFHLQSDSPCIDAGGVVFGLLQDFEGDPRPMDGTSEPRGDGSEFDIGADEFPGTVLPPPTPTPIPTPPPSADYSATFEGSSDDWQFKTVSPMALHSDHWANALIITDDHAIGLEDPDDATNYFAMWDGWQGVDDPLIPWTDDRIYVAYFRVSASGAGPVPSMRMRFFTNHNKFNSYVRIYPADWIEVPTHGTDTLEVPVVNHPVSVDTGENGFALAFDIVDFTGDPRGGHVGIAWLDEITVYSYDASELDTAFSGVRSYSAAQLDSEWSPMSSPAPGYSLPILDSDTSGLHITTTAADTMHFGAWTVDGAQQASYTNGDLHRIVYNVQASSVTAPQMRLRTHSQDYYFASYVEIVPGSGDGEAMPMGATDVPVYFWPPGTVSGTPEIVMAFDGIDIELSAFLGGTISLHSVDVQKMTGTLPH